jgi:hypothetical protein
MRAFANLALVGIAVGLAACQMLSGADSLSIDKDEMLPNPIGTGGSPSAGSRSTVAGRGGSGGSARAGVGGGGVGGSGVGGSRGGSGGWGGAAVGGTGGGSPDAGIPTGPQSPTPCTSDTDCGGAKCLRQGWCEVSCTDSSPCGTAISGEPNVCGIDYPEPDRKFCYASCRDDNDCAAYPDTVCQRFPGSTRELRLCEVPSSTAWPCSDAANCEAGLSCVAELWCSPDACMSDAECGLSLQGAQNRCLTNSEDSTVCAPGCSTPDDCIFYPGTVCRAAGTAIVCLPPVIGSFCTGKADCGEYECINEWCTPATCDETTDCGKTVAGNPNTCVVNGLDTNLCFPGCAANADCAAFEQTSCQPVGSARVCALYRVGTRCTENIHCGNDWICTDRGWCTPPSCTGDADCNVDTPSGAPQSRCLEDVSTNSVCFPGCVSATDCERYPGTICTQGVCTGASTGT